MKVKNELLKNVSRWYSEQCDGEWEHGAGIRIGTLDNPGWMLKVNLRSTPAEHADFKAVNIDHGESDWLSCLKKMESSLPQAIPQSWQLSWKSF